MLLFLIVVCIFLLLLKVTSLGDSDKASTLTFELPNKIIANDRPEMSLMEREHRRRKLLNQVFAIGFNAREQLREKQLEDYKLSITPYYINSKKYDNRKIR